LKASLAQLAALGCVAWVGGTRGSRPIAVERDCAKPPWMAVQSRIAVPKGWTESLMFAYVTVFRLVHIDFSINDSWSTLKFWSLQTPCNSLLSMSSCVADLVSTVCYL